MYQVSGRECLEPTAGDYLFPSDILISTLSNKANMLAGVHVGTKLPHSPACYEKPKGNSEVSVSQLPHAFAKQFPVMTPWCSEQ